MDETDEHNPLTSRSATNSPQTRVSSHLPAWQDTSRPMMERRAALRQAMQPAHPQQRANILGLLASRYPVSNSTDASTLALQSKLLADDLDDLPAEVLRDACREAARTCRFMPLAAEIIACAKPAMDKFREEMEHLDAVDRIGRYDVPSPKPYKPDYVSLTDATNALDEMRAAFDASDEREGINRPKADYATGPITIAIPAHSDASPELQAFRNRPRS